VTLLRESPERLWRRLGCIAFEDIGVADLHAVALVTAATAGKRFRSELGGEWTVGSFLISRLSDATKCRAADDLLLAAENHPGFEDERLAFAFRSIDQLTQITLGVEPLPIRALATGLPSARTAVLHRAYRGDKATRRPCSIHCARS
jgi:hypothetical protein